MLSIVIALALHAAPCQPLQGAALTACLEAELRQVVALDLAGQYPGVPCIEYHEEALRQCFAVYTRIEHSLLEEEARQQAAVQREFEARAREHERRRQELEQERRELEERAAARRAAQEAEARAAADQEQQRSAAAAPSPPVRQTTIVRTTVRQSSGSDQVRVEYRTGGTSVAGRACGLAETGLGSCPMGYVCRLISQSRGVCERD